MPVPQSVLQERHNPTVRHLPLINSRKNFAFLVMKFNGRTNVSRTPILRSGNWDWTSNIRDQRFMQQRRLTRRSLPALRSWKLAGTAQLHDYLENLIIPVKYHTEPRLLFLAIRHAISQGKLRSNVQYIHIHTKYSPCDDCHEVIREFVRLFGITVYVTYNKGYKSRRIWHVAARNNIARTANGNRVVFLTGPNQGAYNQLGGEVVAVTRSYVLEYS